MRQKFYGLHKLILDVGIAPNNLEFKIYACGTKDGELVEPTKSVAQTVKSRVNSYYNRSRVIVEALGATKLYELWRFKDDCNATLRQLAAIESEDQILALVSIPDYYKFITTEDGSLRPLLFDGNVRDFLGKNKEVNRSIHERLEGGSENQAEFWWLNNGITVLVSQQPGRSGSTWTLEGVQIVNGLQTSHIIYDYFGGLTHLELENDSKAANLKDEKLLVKIIHTDDVDISNQIIQATNSQSAVPQASLRATDPIHRRIEEYFEFKRGQKLVYDRRRGAAINRGISPHSIIQINELAQFVLAIYLLQPDTARARPGSALKEDSLYQKIFSEKIDLSEYLWIAETGIQVERHLRVCFKKSEVNNIRFYVMSVLALHLSKLERSKVLIDNGDRMTLRNAPIKIDLSSNLGISPTLITDVASVVMQYLQQTANDAGIEMSRVAKGRDFKFELISKIYDKRTKLYGVLNAES